MKAKSIFSKILSGALALGMVAGMLPAMTMHAEAAATDVTISFGNWYDGDTTIVAHPEKNHVSLRQYPSSESALSNPLALPEIGQPGNGLGAPTATWGPLDNSEDIKLVIVPDAYWEFSNRPAVPGRGFSADNKPDAKESTEVWKDKTAEGNRYTIVKNEADKSGRSWIMTIKANSIKDSIKNLNIRIDQPDPIKVKITVNVGDNLDVEEISWLPQTGSRGTAIAKTRTWEVSYDEDEEAYAVKNVSDGNSVPKKVSEYGTPHKFVANSNNTYSSEILIAARRISDANDFSMEVTAGDKKNYNKSELVALLDPTQGDPGTPGDAYDLLTGETKALESDAWEWASGKVDETSYIGLYRLNGSKNYFTSPISDAKGTPYTKKKDLPNMIDNDVWFTINPEDIFRLYVFGNAVGDDGMNGAVTRGADGTKADARSTWGELKRQGGDPDATGKNFLNRYNPAYKEVIIDLNMSAKKGAFKIENGEDISDTVSVANMYKYSYVIRQANGYRWDGAETGFDSYATYSADPAEFPYGDNWAWPGVRGYQENEKYMTTYKGAEIKEGDKIEFKVLIDPTFKKGDDFQVEVIGNDDRTGLEKTIYPEYDAATDTYSFVVGPYSPYRIKCSGVDPQTLRWVRNIPEDRLNSNYYPIPSYDAGESDPYTGITQAKIQTGIGGHFEEQFLLDAFYEYFNRFRSYDSCNVANPRHQIYIMAHEEDDLFVDLVAFARRRAVATEAAWSGHQFPVGDTKFKVRFNNEWIIEDSQSVMSDRELWTEVDKVPTLNWIKLHGTFDSDVTNDRYTAGPSFKVSQTSAKAGETELKPDDKGVYTLKVADEDVDLRVDGIIRAYQVLTPNVAGYNVEANYPIQRTADNNFRSSVGEGYVYRFKFVPSDGSQKGPDFKVMLRATGDEMDNTNGFVPTEIKEDAEGFYSFTVYNDTEVFIYGVTGTGFNDVATRSNDEQEAINYLKDAGVVDGYDDGSFRPGNNLTRAEFVKMLNALKNGGAGTANFSDTNGHWAAPQIGWAAGQNVVNGYPDGTFKPNQSITRAEVSQVIWKLAGGQISGLKSEAPDVNQGLWYANAVNWAYEKGVIKGFEDGSFRPNAPIERAHMALILYRARGMF